VEACIWEGDIRIPFDFHLMNKQVDLTYDGIIGQISYIKRGPI
jgi:hypothetical protein